MAPSIHSQLCAVNETGKICGQEDNCLSNLVGGCRTTRWRLGGQLFEALAHRVGALCAVGSGAHCVHANTGTRGETRNHSLVMINVVSTGAREGREMHRPLGSSRPLSSPSSLRKNAWMNAFLV